MDKSKLKALGLSDQEIKIYIALLEGGPLSASQLSKNTNTYRPYVYDTLENLIGKELVTHTIKESKKEFKCAPPSALNKLLKKEKDQLKQKQDIVDLLMPKLEKIYSKPFSEFIEERFEGENVINDFNNKILNLKKKTKINEILCFGKDFEFEEEKLKIKVKKINKKMDKGIIVFNDYFAVFEEGRISLIKNKNTSEIIKIMFNMLWSNQ